MFGALFDRIADFKTPIWVVVIALVFGVTFVNWQFDTFLSKAEAQELSEQIDSITLEIRLSSARDDVSRLEAVLYTIEDDPANKERIQEINERKKVANHYYDCLSEKLNQPETTIEEIERCEKHRH